MPLSVEELVKFIQELADSNEIFTIRKLASAIYKLYQGEALKKIDAECPKCHLQNVIFDFHKPPMNCQYCGADLKFKLAEEAEESYTIQALADTEGNLLYPFFIGIEKITQFGIYKVYGKKWWVIRAGRPAQEAEVSENCDFYMCGACVRENPFRKKCSGICKHYELGPMPPENPAQKVKLPEEWDGDKLDIVRIDPDKRQFVQAIQLAINELRENFNALIRWAKERKNV